MLIFSAFFFSQFLYLSDMLLRQEDLSMALALVSTWTMFLAFGSLACIGPISYIVGMAYQNAFSPGLPYSSQPSAFGIRHRGYPVVSASGKNLSAVITLHHLTL
jgi:hypothetical protein